MENKGTGKQKNKFDYFDIGVKEDDELLIEPSKEKPIQVVMSLDNDSSMDNTTHRRSNVVWPLKVILPEEVTVSLDRYSALPLDYCCSDIKKYIH